MGVKILKLNIFSGSTNRHALFRALIIASALSVVPLMNLCPGTEVTAKNRAFGDDAAVDLVHLGRFVNPEPKLFLDKLVGPFWGKLETEKYPEVVIADLIEELMGLKLLHYDAKVLYIGPGTDSAVSMFKEMGFSDVHGVPKHPLFSFFSRMHVYELELSGEKSFDFVFCGDVDQVASPALRVLEMERVLKPGGTGAVLVSTIASGLVKSATSVSLWLKQSEIVHVNYLDEFIVIVFKRNVTETAPNWFLPSYPIDSKAFNVYFVDHNTSVMLSYVKKPGVIRIWLGTTRQAKT